MALQNLQLIGGGGGGGGGGCVCVFLLVFKLPKITMPFSLSGLRGTFLLNFLLTIFIKVTFTLYMGVYTSPKT